MAKNDFDIDFDFEKELGFDPKAIYEACKETTKGTPTFGYLDKVLEGIHSRSAGSATTEKQVQKALQDEKAETQRIRELGMDPESYSFYLDLRRYGSARHAGFGLGFERCVMYLTGMSNIRDVIPFPRTVGNCEF